MGRSRRPLEFPETPLHTPRRKRPHVAQEYRDNEQIETAQDLVRNLTAKAREAIGV